MGDAVVRVADHQFAQITSRGMAVGDTASLVEGAAPDRSGSVWEVDLPVTVGVVFDADEWVGGGWHTRTVAPNRAAVIRGNCVSARRHAPGRWARARKLAWPATIPQSVAVGR
jgi:hypothetical protein